MARKTKLRLWPTIGAFETSKEFLLNEFLSEKTEKLTQKSEENRNFFARSSALASPSPGPCQPEPLLSTNTGMYR